MGKRHRADDDASEELVLTVGEVGPIETPRRTDHPAAVLWIPDPEQRHGWREFYVYRAAKPGRRPPGFGQ